MSAHARALDCGVPRALSASGAPEHPLHGRGIREKPASARFSSTCWGRLIPTSTLPTPGMERTNCTVRCTSLDSAAKASKRAARHHPDVASIQSLKDFTGYVNSSEGASRYKCSIYRISAPTEPVFQENGHEVVICVTRHESLG